MATQYSSSLLLVSLAVAAFAVAIFSPGCGGRIAPTLETNPDADAIPSPSPTSTAGAVPTTTPAPAPVPTSNSVPGDGSARSAGSGAGDDGGVPGLGPIALSAACGVSYAGVITDQEACPNDSYYFLAEVPRAFATLTFSAPTTSGALATLTVTAGMTYVINVVSQSGTVMTLGTGVTIAPGVWAISSGTFDCGAATMTLEAVVGTQAGTQLGSPCDIETWQVQ